MVPPNHGALRADETLVRALATLITNESIEAQEMPTPRKEHLPSQRRESHESLAAVESVVERPGPAQGISTTRKKPANDATAKLNAEEPKLSLSTPRRKRSRASTQDLQQKDQTGS